MLYVSKGRLAPSQTPKRGGDAPQSNKNRSLMRLRIECPKGAKYRLRPEFEERLDRAVSYVAAGGRLLSRRELADQLEDTGGV